MPEKNYPAQTATAIKKLSNLLALLLLVFLGIEPAFAVQPAKKIFGGMALPSKQAAASYGFYSKGCISGAVAMPIDGPTWQVMRLSRNRRWGHPTLISIIEKLSIKAKRDGWNGLLVGDISQPRGGPMLTGHRSHQIGLDADIWLTPMPDRRLTYKEREQTSAISIKKGRYYVNEARWNKSFERLLYHAASFNQVERLLVHPSVKKKLCDTVKGDRAWLNKVRPYYGHHYHFHMRIGCQPSSSGCRRQKSTGTDIGCGKQLQWWFDVGLRPPKKVAKPTKPAKPKKPKKRRQMVLADLPKACANVVSASSKSKDEAVYKAGSLLGFNAPRLDMPKIDPFAALNSKPIEASAAKKATSKVALPKFDLVDVRQIPVPAPRPIR